MEMNMNKKLLITLLLASNATVIVHASDRPLSSSRNPNGSTQQPSRLSRNSSQSRRSLFQEDEEARETITPLSRNIRTHTGSSTTQRRHSLPDIEKTIQTQNASSTKTHDPFTLEAFLASKASVTESTVVTDRASFASSSAPYSARVRRSSARLQSLSGPQDTSPVDTLLEEVLTLLTTIERIDLKEDTDYTPEKLKSAVKIHKTPQEFLIHQRTENTKRIKKHIQYLYGEIILCKAIISNVKTYPMEPLKINAMKTNAKSIQKLSEQYSTMNLNEQGHCIYNDYITTAIQANKTIQKCFLQPKSLSLPGSSSSTRAGTPSILKRLSDDSSQSSTPRSKTPLKFGFSKEQPFNEDEPSLNTIRRPRTHVATKTEANGIILKTPVRKLSTSPHAFKSYKE
jgi:hypothetical protein